MNKRIFKISILVTVLAFASQSANAQHGFGIDNPDKSAAIDIVSKNKGLLIPRISLEGFNIESPITSPAEGLLVYNEGNAITKGFYYWDGDEWVVFTTSLTDLNTKNASLTLADNTLKLTDTDGIVKEVNLSGFVNDGNTKNATLTLVGNVLKLTDTDNVSKEVNLS